MKVLIVLALFALAYAKEDLSVEDLGRFCVGKPWNANYRNPWRCNSYIQCSDAGKAYVMPCPAGLNFNPDPRPYGQCDHVSCRPPAPTTVRPPQPPSTTTPVPPHWCRGKPWNANYPNPNNPNSYIMCNDAGVPVVMPCPAGLTFKWSPRPYGHCGY